MPVRYRATKTFKHGRPGEPDVTIKEGDVLDEPTFRMTPGLRGAVYNGWLALEEYDGKPPFDPEVHADFPTWHEHLLREDPLG